MKQYTKLPDSLDKNKDLETKLNSDIPKRTGKLKIVRHRVKQLLNKIIK